MDFLRTHFPPGYHQKKKNILDFHFLLSIGGFEKQWWLCWRGGAKKKKREEARIGTPQISFHHQTCPKNFLLLLLRVCVCVCVRAQRFTTSSANSPPLLFSSSQASTHTHSYLCERARSQWERTFSFTEPSNRPTDGGTLGNGSRAAAA